ncbi:MAG: DNA polymerase IV, partial [Prolixibacteraceae bacterium]|nr:DNA polymerase IV [Prolixibacteraceae bacterium]MBN2773287.1 DNA polymerase IV [Prolixibacteraceae bacterium]
MDSVRKIIHIDMDAFYASVEQRDNPDLRGKPVAVGGSGDRGVVAAASYEARKFGVRSALSSKVAIRNCPDLIFVPPRFDVYKKVSNQIHEIFHEYTDLVEPLSLDEAYLDVTYAKKGKPSATLIAREIKRQISEETGLTASAGVSYNKFLAKVASDMDKPDGLYVITPGQAEEFINKLEIKKFFGIGKVTAKKLNEMGIWFGKELKKLERLELINLFGKAGSYYYDIARGIDNRPVEPSRERKSIGAENTFLHDLYRQEDLRRELEKISKILWGRVERSGKEGKTLTLKIKFADFEQITRSKTISGFFDSEGFLFSEGIKLLKKEEPLPKGIRLLGLTVSNFPEEKKGPVQLTIEF